MASIHRKAKDGTWYVSYRQDGKLKQRSLGTTNERKALQLKREIELALDECGFAEVVISNQPRSETKDPPVDEFWTTFYSWAKNHRSANTVIEYDLWFKQFREYTGMTRLGGPSRSDAESFKAKLLKQGKNKHKGVGLSKVSINNALKTLKSIWNQAKKLDLYSGSNPFANVEKFRIPQRAERGYLEGEQIELLLKASEQYAHERNILQANARNVRFAIALMALAGLIVNLFSSGICATLHF